MKVILYLFAILVISTSCAYDETSDLPDHIRDYDNLIVFPADLDPLFNIKLERVQVFGETDNVFFGRIGKISIDQEQRVYISDELQKVIHVYSEDGNHLTKFGREGQGPGEFQQISDIGIENDRIHILDSRQEKISVYDLQTYHHLSDYNVSIRDLQSNSAAWISRTQDQGLNYRVTNLFICSDGNYLLFFNDSSLGTPSLDDRTFEVSIYDPLERNFLAHDILSFKWTGRVMVFENDDMSVFFHSMPYKRSSEFDFRNGQIVHGWTEEMFFKFFNQDGEYQKSFYYPFSKVTLNVNDIINHHIFGKLSTLTIEAIQNDTLPETWPAFDSIMLDDENRLWISAIVENLDTYEWWILDENGELIARLNLPAIESVQAIQNGYLYTREMEEETEIQQIVKYRIEIGI